MRPVQGTAALRLALVAACLSLVALAGCAPPPSIDLSDPEAAVDSTGTVQATMAADPSAPVDPTSPATATPAAPVKGPWPARVGTFAKSFKGPVWWPMYIPKGFKIDNVDVVEFEPGSGLVCDIAFASGDKAIVFTQGSPKTREPDAVSGTKVPWGSESGDVMYEDPADPNSPKYIIYYAKGTLVELAGDVSFEELKAVAASMVPVK
ncbi:MAG: hypothetical protein Q7W30_08625 [Coriobacteriia bacterium]|nr:hypothetical protein [Coriobacteriia bacterium]